jgi:hypothetical protein
MTALQKIIKGAKTLQKKNKNLSWKDAVKKSSKVYNASKKPVAKKVVKKKAVSKKIAAVKKIPAKKTGSHKDTKSHNVNIRVVSGANMYLIRDMQEKNIKQTLQLIDWTKKEKHSREKALTLKRLRANLVLQKKQLKEQNRLINQNLK